jgi:tetratricopeptide (TPR) repeat protein
LAAAKAVELDASLADAHLAIAESLLYHDWDFAGAEKEFRKTLDLNPNYSTGHQWYGEFLSLMGRHAEAIREQRAALALDPLSAIIHHQAAATMRDAGLYDEAIKQYQEALKISPEFLAAYEAMYWTLRRQGRFVESIHPLQMAIAALVADDNPAIAAAVNELRPAYARAGRTGYFLQCLKVHRYYERPHFYLARDYAELGDRDAALAALARSYEDHDIEALWLLTDPELDSLRADARFQRLIRAVGFPH